MQSAPLEVAHASRRIVVAATMLGLFLAAVDQTIVSTALPRIIADLQGIGLLAWVFTAYMLSSTIVVPLVGKLGDQFGRKPVFIVAIVVFLVGSFAAGASQTMLQLVIFRGLQGLGGGMLFATSFAIIGDLYAPSERGRVQGAFAATFGIASVIGPALGGWITDASSWRWVFYINLPVGIVALVVVLFGMPWTRPHSERRPRIDLLGAALLTGTLLPFLLALVWAGDRYDWVSWQVTALFVLSGGLLVLFVLAERRAAEPIVPLLLFRNRTFVISAIVVFLVGGGMFGAITMLPLFLQGVQGVEASRAGTLMVPLSLAIVTGGTIAGQLMSRTGRYKALVLIGSAVMVVGMFLFSRIDANTGRPELIRNMVLVGLGLGVTFPVFAVVVQNALPYHLLGVATSGVQFFRSIGGTVGIALFTGLMLHQFRDGLRGTTADMPVVTDNLSKLLNERGALEVERAYEASVGAGGTPWETLLGAIRVEQAEAIATVFLVATGIIALAFIASWLLPELELQRTSPAEMARRMGAAQDGREATPALGAEAATASASSATSATSSAPGDS